MDTVIPFYKSKNSEKACLLLMEKARTLWKLKDSCIDDISCIVIFLKDENDDDDYSD